MMNKKPLICLLACLAVPAAWASSPMQGLQFEQQKQQVLKDIRKTCSPSKNLTENEFANQILASEDNKRRVREATLAMERNDQKSYWDALSQIECPDM